MCFCPSVLLQITFNCKCCIDLVHDITFVVFSRTYVLEFVSIRGGESVKFSRLSYNVLNVDSPAISVYSTVCSFIE